MLSEPVCITSYDHGWLKGEVPHLTGRESAIDTALAQPGGQSMGRAEMTTSGAGSRLCRLGPAAVLALCCFNATAGEAQQSEPDPARVAGCYAVEHGAWDAELERGYHPSPSQLAALVRLDTTRFREMRQDRWYTAHPVPALPPRQGGFRMWRFTAPDSVAVVEFLPFAGFHLEAAVEGDSLRGQVTAFTDMLVDGKPSEVRAPFVGRRVPCPASP